MQRRNVLKLLAGGAAAVSLHPLLRAAGSQPADFFIFIHASGGWDVTLWADPRNEHRGMIEPASTATIDVSGIRHWKTAGDSFEPVAVKSLVLGPAIGDLYDLADRLTIVNGIAMNTVSHPDGIAYSCTGRHRTGGTLPESSIDVLVANERGVTQMMPDVSIRFPSAFVGTRLDRRAVPLRVDDIGALTKSFERSGDYLDGTDRAEITALLSDEASALAKSSTHPATYEQLGSQQQSLATLLKGDFTRAFQKKALEQAYPQFNYKGRFYGNQAAVAAFAVEAIKRNLVRCVSFALGQLDTHGANYRQHGVTLQELFDIVASIVKLLDQTPHPTSASTRLSERTHILIVSEFCRTPQINPNGGRDHYPNNSALVISPKFRGGRSFGKTDPEQLLPVDFGKFTDGIRPIAPPDILATFLGAFGIDPRRYMRDGEIVKALLA
jgi:hypothetical protein